MKRGYTLVELMIVTVFAGVTIATATGFLWSIAQAERQSRGYVEDVLGLRRAVRTIESDMRAGKADRIRLDGDVLLRDDRMLARRIERYELRREGPLRHVEIALMPRQGGEPAVVRFTVRESPR
ncbi:MAG: type II secretion system protein [Planctomycetota bacterium]